MCIYIYTVFIIIVYVCVQIGYQYKQDQTRAPQLRSMHDELDSEKFGICASAVKVDNYQNFWYLLYINFQIKWH